MTDVRDITPAPLPEQGRGRGFIASASTVALDNVRDVTKLARVRQSWQKDAWTFAKEIAEASYVKEFTGDVLSRLRLFAAEQDDPESEPTPTENPIVIQAVRELDEGEAGLTGIQRDFAVNLLVAGECFLIGQPNNRDTEWDIYSVSEVVPDRQGKLRLRMDPRRTSASDLEDLHPGSFVMRIWRRDAEYSRLAESHFRALLDTFESLIIEERAARALARSRMATAGILLLPDEAFPPTPPGQDPHQDPIQQRLERLIIAAIQDEGQPSAVVPLVLRLASQYIEKVRHVTFDRKEDDKRIERVQSLLRRVAQGLPIPPEIILGTASLNHWSSWAVDESVWKHHMEPLAIMLADALTARYLRPLLEESGMSREEAKRFRVWYDSTKVVTKPDQSIAADTGHNLGILSDEAWLQAHGFSEDDRATFYELLRRIAYKIGDPATFLQTAKPTDLTPDEAAALGVGGGGPAAELPGPPDPNDPFAPNGSSSPAPASYGPPSSGPPTTPRNGRSGPPTQITAAATADSLESLGQRLYTIDAALAGRLVAAADTTLRSAVSKAGSRIRQAAKRDQSVTAALKQVAHYDVPRTIGPTLVASLGLSERDLVEDTIDGLRDRFLSWTARSQAQATAAIRSHLPASELDQLALDQRADRDAAWDWFRSALIARTIDSFYEPGHAPDAEPDGIGEHDDTVTIPFDLVREALARAGGADEVAITASAPGELERLDSLVAALPRIIPRLRRWGMSLGRRITQALERVGIAASEHEWVYGEMPRRTFPPHKALDGIRFADWESEPLATTEKEFPYVPYYFPGDHRGCACATKARLHWLPGRDSEPTFTPAAVQASGELVQSPHDEQPDEPEEA